MKSPLCAVAGCLFAFGGKDEDNQPFSTIHRFVEKKQHMEGSRIYDHCTVQCCTVAIFSFQHKDEDLVDVFVIGGYLGENSKMKLGCCITDKCEVLVTKN
jgi:hypothetical protein